MRKYLLLAATAGLLAAPALAQTADHAAHSPKAGPQTRVELQQHIAQRFAALDTNKDGAVTKAEFDAHRAAMKQKWEQHKKERRDAFFARADTNKDGKVTLAEMSARPLAMFDKADANKDGTVTPEERRAAWQNMRAQWRAKAPPAAKAG